MGGGGGDVSASPRQPQTRLHQGFPFKHLPASQLLLPFPQSNAGGRTDSEGDCAAAQNEDAQDWKAAVQHKGSGRNNFNPPNHQKAELTVAYQ